MMTDVTMEWFRATVKTLPAVRGCYPARESAADYIIRTWMGMSVKVYFLNGVPNLRALKRELQENTRAYSGTLFVAHHALMPADKARLVPDDWMAALHELNSERIYTYHPGETALFQVHFDHLPDGIEREAWYGGEVTFEKLRVTKVTARTRAIKGNWMMADFGPNPYWANREFRAQRLNERYWKARRRTGEFVWGRYDVGGHPGGATDQALNRAHNSQLERCYTLLGVEVTATRDEIKAAYRKLARQYHPDTSQLAEGEAQARFQELTAAYETIKSKHRWT
jgi:hypothetical protein